MNDSVDYEQLLEYLTSDRLSSYRRKADSVQDVFRLYEWNMRVAASVMELTGMVEVIVRNALDRSLTNWISQRDAGATWLDIAPLDSRGKKDIAKARSRATRSGKNPEVHGKVIAELSLGFWRFLIESKYFTSLWVPATHEAFPYGASDLRARQRQVKSDLQRLHFVRNRAAHHEPLHSRSLDTDFQAAIEILGWIDPNAAKWAQQTSTLPQVLLERP